MVRRRGLSKSERKWQQRCVSSGPEPWVFDMANGMSNRRSTLKRPIVCRSKKDGNCGVVALTVEIIPQQHAQGDHVIMTGLIEAQKQPMDTTYDVVISGPYLCLDPQPKIVVGQLTQWELVAPMVSGTYTTYVVCVNSQGCRVDSQADSVVI